MGNDIYVYSNSVNPILAHGVSLPPGTQDYFRMDDKMFMSCEHFDFFKLGNLALKGYNKDLALMSNSALTSLAYTPCF